MQLVVPKKFCQDILRDLHEGVAGGHLGEVKTLSKLKQRFYRFGHYNDVRDWCQTCKACAKRKSPVPGRLGSLANNNCRLPNTSYGSRSFGTTPRKQEWQLLCVDSRRLFFPVDGSSYLPVPNQEVSVVAERLVDEVFL